MELEDDEGKAHKGLLGATPLGPAVSWQRQFGRTGAQSGHAQSPQAQLPPPLMMMPPLGMMGRGQLSNLDPGLWPSLNQSVAPGFHMNPPQGRGTFIPTQEFSRTPGHRDRSYSMRSSDSMESLESLGSEHSYKGAGRQQQRSQSGTASPSKRGSQEGHQKGTPLFSYGLSSSNRKTRQDSQPSAPRPQDRAHHPPVERPTFTMPVGRISVEQADSIAKNCIDQLSEAREYVSLERIEKLLLQRLQRNSLREMNLPRVRSIDHLDSVKEHSRTMCRVNAYIQAFVQVRSICTLHELGECLREFAPDKEHFDSLKLGPLQKQPVIYNQFKFPPAVEEIPEITPLDILQHLREYMTKSNKWTEKLEMEPVMDYIVDQYNVPDAFHLGVRIRSLPLAAQVLKKAQRDAASTRRQAYDSLKAELKRDVEAAMHRFRAAILQSSSTDDGETRLEIRQHYLETTPEVVIMEIFSKFQLLMSLENPDNRAARKRHQRMMNAISEFLTTVRDDDMASKLFHISICIGSMELQEVLTEHFTPEVDSSCEQGGTVAPQQMKPPPLIGHLMEKLRTYLDRCICHGSITLEHLERIEEKLLGEFDFLSFHGMGFRSFLWFLLNQPEAKSMLEESCGLVLGSSGAQDSTSLYHPRHTEVLEVIRQSQRCGVIESRQFEDILCNQFQVKEVRNLGFGGMDRLKKVAMETHGRHQAKDYSVIYEATLCPNSRQVVTAGQVGIMGHQTKEKALACLHNCPLLEDLGEWSNWTLVFEPELGPLKDFVQKYGGLYHFEIEGGFKMATTDIVALEAKPGQLLKLVSQTSPEKFAEAAKAGNVVGTCGHILSQIVASRGLKNTPLALLTNHIKAALFSMHANSVDSLTPGGPPQRHPGYYNSAVKFVLHCLHTLPMRITVALANQIFLDPLGQVVGSTKSKTLLLSAAEGEGLHLSHLHKLGCLLGIHEWTANIQTKWQFSTEAIVVTGGGDDMEGEEAWLETGKETDMEIVEDEESDSESTSDIFISSDSDSSDSDVEEIEQPTTTTTIGDKETADKMEESNIDTTTITISDEVEQAEECKSGEETEESEEEEESSVDRCRVVIDRIRKEEFGIGVQLSEDGQKLMRVQQERLGRSLDRLSKDLYSKDTHFVLELVQNADDNDYPRELSEPTSGECPTVEFVVDTDRVEVHNNECGFEESNISALCDVGRSTKGKHKYGYIGQKGIGFKSVFRVTDCPEVHSNGYHICFDVASGPTGYILPHWVEQTEESEQGETGRWMTRIVLPYKGEIQNRTLAARFNDIHPSLLLFLHRLRCITINNKVENSVVSMRRRDLGENFVEIEHSDRTDRWLVVKKRLDASQISLQAKSGIEVESTEIAMAFPVKPSGQKNTPLHLPPKQQVFAFLPLHSYGFRFIIQGDFDVPSSREDVDKDSAWNQWLRNEIPALFIESFDVFRAQNDFSLMDAICTFLQFVPMEDEILDFFQPVATHILQKLRGKNFIPTHPNSKGQVFMKKPSQVITTRDSLVKEVVTGELLQRHLSLFYLHGDVAAVLNPSLTQALGIETVMTQHLLQVGQAIALSLQPGGQTGFEADVVLVAKWLACVYRSLDDLQSEELVLTTLRSMKIIPLSGGEFVSLDTRTVFFPVSEATPGHGAKGDPFTALQQDLFAMHHLLLNTPDTVVNPQVRRLLDKLGVKSLSPSEVINHHIMPILKSDSWKDKPRELLVCYLIYMKVHIEGQPNIVNMEELRLVAQVSTTHGLRNPASQPIHFTPAFENKVLLTQQLPGYDWVLLDSIYLRQPVSHSEIQGWREFFTKLGVVDFLFMEQRKVHLTEESMDSTPWAPLKSMWRHLPDGYIINDCCCEEFRKLVEENSQADLFIEQMQKLCEMIDRDWDSTYSRYCTVQVADTAGKTHFETESSFSIQLHSFPWLPGVLSEPVTSNEQDIRLKQSVTLMQPSLLYIRQPELERLLGYSVPYLSPRLSNQSSFAEFLSVKRSVDTKTVRELLLKWSTREHDKQPATFCTSLQHIKAVYRYLYENSTAKEWQDLLDKNPLIFIPKNRLQEGESIESQRLIIGVMLRREEVWWIDPTRLFSRHRASLQEYHIEVGSKKTLAFIYRDLEEYFTGRLARIQYCPSMAEYAQLWIHITSTEVLGRENSPLQDVLRLMVVLGEGFMKALTESDPTVAMLHSQEKESLLKTLKGQKIFPTKKNVWVSSADHPMIADNKQLVKMFQDMESVHLLCLEENTGPVERQKMKKLKGHHHQTNSEAIHMLLDACSIETLSKSVTAMDVTELSQPCPELKMYMHKVVPYIQQYLLTHYEDEVYRELVEKNMANALQNMLFTQVAKLEVVYSLKHNPDIVVRKNENCIYDYEGNTFFFQKDHLNCYSDVGQEISKCFCEGNTQCGKDLRGFLAELTSIFQTGGGRVDQSVEEMLVRHEVVPLLHDEIPWEVPKPIVHQPIQQTPPVEEAQEAGPSPQADGDGTLRAWPPISGGPPREPREPSMDKKEDRPASNVWPPPKPPEYMKGLHELPPRFRNLAPESGGQGDGEAKEENSADSGAGQRRDYQKSSHEEVLSKPRPEGGSGDNRSDANRAPHAGGQGTHAGPSGFRHEGTSAGRQEYGSEGSGDRASAGPGPGSDTGGNRVPQTRDTHMGEGDTHPYLDIVPPKDGSPMDLDGNDQPVTGRKRYPSGDMTTPSPKKPALHLGAPVWDDSIMTDMLYEELGTGDSLVFPEDIELDLGSEIPIIGDWGETLVNTFLLRQQELDSSIQSVIWAKEIGEHGTPYDFEVRLQRPGKEPYSVFIEVKTTLSCAKETFEISSQELRFALEKGDCYHIYRIYGAGSKDSVKLVRIRNVAFQFDKKNIRLCMVI